MVRIRLLIWAFNLGAGDENRTRIGSLGIAVGPRVPLSCNGIGGLNRPLLTVLGRSLWSVCGPGPSASIHRLVCSGSGS
jgi:hypothetical protein